MDLYTQIQVFVWAIDSGNFSAAARDHDLTPSTVSKAIGQLEKRLNVRLFYRGPHAHVLTQEGLSYEPTARELIRAMTAAQSVGESLPQQVTGVLRIHTMATFAKHQILRRLPAFLAQHPDLSVEIQVGAQYVDLLDRGVDIAIHSGVLPDSSHIAHRLGEAEWIVCASPRYMEKFGAPRVPADLLNHRCFNFAFASPWNSWSFRENEEVITVPVQCRASFTQGDLLRDLALAGEGIVRLANFHIGGDLATGKRHLIWLSYSKSGSHRHTESYRMHVAAHQNGCPNDRYNPLLPAFPFAKSKRISDWLFVSRTYLTPDPPMGYQLPLLPILWSPSNRLATPPKTAAFQRGWNA